MADVHSREQRSYNMSRIRSTHTKPEVLVRKFLFANGFRYKLHDKKLPGRPDIIFPKYRTVIFVHGCFWHGHKDCKYFVVPKTRTDWWLNKINTNIGNDDKAVAALKKEGWKVITLWECNLKPTTAAYTLNSSPQTTSLTFQKVLQRDLKANVRCKKMVILEFIIKNINGKSEALDKKRIDCLVKPLSKT